MSEPGSQEQPDEALMDLLVKQVAEGLSPAEQRALDALDSAVSSDYRRDFERAAAAISLSGAGPAESMPPALKERLEQLASTFAAPFGAVAGVVELRAARTAAQPPPRSLRQSAALGWFAAAACLLLAIFAWVRPPQTAPVAVQRQAAPPPVMPPVPRPPEPPTAAEARAALLAKTESLKVPLAATKDPAAAGVSGDVVWDPASQTGFVHVAGLAPNDPTRHQYQLWIFDGTRDQRYPVDGGVFDVPANSAEVVIPIHAALAVGKPGAFAVTLEKPGGVVVSARDHVLVLGAAS